MVTVFVLLGFFRWSYF